MDARNALRFSAYYHALALVASTLGLVVAAAGLYVGLGDALGTVTLTNPTSLLNGVGLSGLGIAAAGVVAGVYVRRVGHTAARLKVETTAVEQNVDLPSTSVIGRKVGGEVSTQVAEVISEVVSEAEGNDNGFEFGDAGDSTDDVPANSGERPADD